MQKSVTCSVQSKISCIFGTQVIEIPSKKRFGQNYKIVATKQISKQALASDVKFATVTEKIDGTCCCVKKYQGQICLWARFDRKPSKSAEKRFKKFQNQHREWINNGKQGEEPRFKWNYPDDMKVVPQNWVPADGVERTGVGLVPDANGHIPGWVPISSDPRQYCWHHCVVVAGDSILVLLRNNGGLKITTVHMSELEGKTLELIGTHVNGNPYGLGSKQSPFHILVEHGQILVNNPPVIDYDDIKDWLNDKAPIEGIVWHCEDGNMFKIHRHHLGLEWPCDVTTPLLCQMPVTIEIEDSVMIQQSPLINKLFESETVFFKSLKDVLS
uniref:RNA ligase 1 n=1 Tax=Ciona savignyi TaxID=51511 RepID=H2ZF46_CIOSA